MFSISLIPAFKDNYIWLLTGANRRAAVVDPGDAAPVLARLEAENLVLESILITHHHADHQGGVGALVERFRPQVFGPENESITGCNRPLSGGESISILDCPVDVLAVPGHTLGHLAYVAEGVVFCGDTLFGAGCGRLFEGTPEQMFASLSALSALPDTTKLYCAHEYTAMNLRFAEAVEPESLQVKTRVEKVAEIRLRQQSTVPLSLAEEKATNPFLRSREVAVIAAAKQNGAVDDSPVAVFAALRQWRNNFS